MVLLVVGVVAIGVSGLLVLDDSTPTAPPPGPTFTYTGTWNLLDLERHIESGEVAAITVDPSQTGRPGDGGTIAARTKDGQIVQVDVGIAPSDALSALASLGYGDLLTDEAWQSVHGTGSPASSDDDPGRLLLTLVLPLVLIGLLIVVLLRFATRGTSPRDSSAQFRTIMPATDRDAAAAARPDAAPPITLADVAGCDEAKLELTETIEFLKAPERFHKLGARIPRGIMLFGPPGTGKTMLARAVASEAGVPFHYASGSEFVEKFVGVGARRIRDLFGQARRMGRGVIFFDEFDAIGKARGGQNSHEEREQTLNQLLVELDGFGTTDDVVVIAATNRLDILDPAVLRPGRFNRKIHVGLPDVKGRREILDVHAKNKPLDAAVDVEVLARKTYGFSGAQLADLLNEAAILAARRRAEAIGPDDIHGGWLKVAVGTARRRSMDERERSIIAAHEVGHAICGRIHGDKRRVEEISLFAHGDALGVTVSSQEDNDLPSETDLRARLVALMGGRAAEELLFQEVTGGASNDFDKANGIATQMVTRWGMGVDPDAKEGGVSGRGSLSVLVARGNGTLPSDVQAAATRAIRAILDEAYAEACRTLVEHVDTLRRIAAYLFEQERIDGDTFDALFEGRLEVPNETAEWRAPTAHPRAWSEIEPYLERRRSGQPRGADEPDAHAPRDDGGADRVPAELPVAAIVDGRVAGAAGPGPIEGATGATRDAGNGRRRQTGARHSVRALGRVVLGRSPVGRRLRGLAVSSLQRAQGWLEEETARQEASRPGH